MMLEPLFALKVTQRSANPTKRNVFERELRVAGVLRGLPVGVGTKVINSHLTLLAAVIEPLDP